MKKENEIRKMLGDRYHLSCSCEHDDENGFTVSEWYLFKTYQNADPVYFSADNKAIMTNETHTEDDLYEFAKSHKKFDVVRVHNKVRLITISIILLISIINIFVASKALTIMILSCDAMFLIWLITDVIVFNRNNRVDTLEMFENFKRL